MFKIIFSLILINFFSMPLFATPSCAHKLKELGGCARIEWKLGPKYGIFSKAQVTLTDETGSPLKNADKLEFYPWMVMEGGQEHGARETVAKKLSEGVYEVSMIHLMKMPGHWSLRIKKAGAKAKSDYLAAIPIVIK